MDTEARMHHKLKLARNILLEAEGIKECGSAEGKISIAEELTKNAIELAQLVYEEENEEEVA